MNLMDFSKFGKTVEKFTVDNSPTILTGVGVVGTVATAYLTAKASFRAAQQISDREFVIKTHPTTPMGSSELETKEKVALVWKNYIPPVGVGTLTVASIIGANRVSMRRAAAMAAAYSLSEKGYREYKEKIVEKLGKNKEQAARDDLAQNRLNNNPPSGQVLLVGDGNVLCMDQYSGRYFHSDMETLRRAENDINFEILNSGHAVLSDFYERVGLKPTSASEEVGWTAPDDRLELGISTILTPDGKPCLSFDLNVKPVRHC